MRTSADQLQHALDRMSPEGRQGAVKEMQDTALQTNDNLVIITGGMESGKTTALRRRHELAALRNEKAVTLIPRAHTRDAPRDELPTRRLVTSATDLLEVLDADDYVEVHFEEGHLWGDLLGELVHLVRDRDPLMRIWVAGLYRVGTWQSLPQLLKFDTFLQSNTCWFCARAGYTQAWRLSQPPTTFNDMVGGREKWLPACEACTRPENIVLPGNEPGDDAVTVPIRVPAPHMLSLLYANKS